MSQSLGHENVHPVDGRRPKCAAIISCKPLVSTPIGFWWSRLAHACHVFTQHRYAIRDGKLITVRQQFSGGQVGDLAVKALGA